MTAGRSVKSRSLIDKSISLVKGFDPKKQTGDSYADEATQTGDSPADVVFLKQVLRSIRTASMNIIVNGVVSYATTALPPQYTSVDRAPEEQDCGITCPAESIELEPQQQGRESRERGFRNRRCNILKM